MLNRVMATPYPCIIQPNEYYRVNVRNPIVFVKKRPNLCHDVMYLGRRKVPTQGSMCEKNCIHKCYMKRSTQVYVWGNLTVYTHALTTPFSPTNPHTRTHSHTHSRYTPSYTRIKLTHSYRHTHTPLN